MTKTFYIDVKTDLLLKNSLKIEFNSYQPEKMV